MCSTIVHRGPDDEGIFVDGEVALGMRRLSIIDLVAGQQPIHNEDKTVWVIFNGEIYNFLELRRDLESRGHRFYTNSDTEVIVHLYEDRDLGFVEKLRGMFAIALWDTRRRRLVLARDRLGKKPLHYAEHDGALLFGSEIKALLAVAPELVEVDPAALVQFFYFGYVPDPRTAFKRIHKLPPGHILDYHDGRKEVRQYWDLPAFGTAKAGREEDLLDELEQRLSEAVRLRLISDVPLGALLSGGVDSSTVVALMARANSGPVKTFSIGFRHSDFNEAEYARAVAQRFATEHHELILEPNITETLDHLTRHLEEPFADSSMLPTYFVSRLARQHVTVALAGDGGDEMFAGYDRYEIHLRRARFPVLSNGLGRLYRDHIYPVLPAFIPGRRFVYNMSLPADDRYLDSVSSLPVTGRERGLFSPDFLAFADSQPSAFDDFRDFLRRAPAQDTVSRLQYLDAKTYLAGDILTKVDRMSMATSLEVRAPILDHVFAEWVTQLPLKWKYRPGKAKYLLKKLAERIAVPTHVIHRPKRGFAIPLIHWMRNELKDSLLPILLEPRTLQRGYFDPATLREIVKEHIRGRRDRSSHLWMLLVFELWHRNFLEAIPRDATRAAGEPPGLALTSDASRAR